MKHPTCDENLNYVGDVDGILVHCTFGPCINYGIEIEVPPSVAVQCGPCQQWITPPPEAT